MNIQKLYKISDRQTESLKTDSFEDGGYEGHLLNIYDEKISEIYGFGGAFTESSAYNYHLASDKVKKQILEYLFGESGLKYNFCRICIGSSDFALDEYTYVEEGDYNLDSFSVERDRKYVIPFIKDAVKFSKNEIKLFASPWSPPAFMKENNTRINGGKLKKECYFLYARYLVKFLQEYQKEGIDIIGLTIQNEPKAIQTWESCFYTTDDEIAFAKVLRAELDNNNLSDIKLYCWDHNKERVFEKAKDIFDFTNNLFDGIGFHWYSGEHFDGVRLVNRKYPDKFLFASEFCLSSGEDYVENLYIDEILNDLNAGANAICEWNLLLDNSGGPFHNRYGGCCSPIIYDAEKDSVSISKTYYDSFIFSHFVERGACSLHTSTFSKNIQISAFRNPDGKIIAVINNTGKANGDTRLYFNKKYYRLPIEEKCRYVAVIEE